MDFFDKIEQLPQDPIFGLTQAFLQDPRSDKVNLGAGVYKTTELKPHILNTVKKAESFLLENESSKDYLMIDGDRSYIEETKKLIFSESGDLEKIYGAQTVGGTGALRIGGAFLREQGLARIFLPDPTWDNHKRIFQQAGLEVRTYPYYDFKRKCFDFEGMLQTIKEEASSSDILLLHGCCHNPTGTDPEQAQWQSLLQLVQEKEIFPFFDFAYQGFGEDPEKDAASLRLFEKAALPFMCAVSHAKNFNLYAERAGALLLRTRTLSQSKAAASHIKLFIRSMYSNPPCHGSRIIAAILQSEELKTHWLDELTLMRERIMEMRAAFLSKLRLKVGPSLDFMSLQKGMFSYTGLKKEETDRLISEYGIYMPKDGRINVAGLNTKNIDYVAEAISAVYLE